MGTKITVMQALVASNAHLTKEEGEKFTAAADTGRWDDALAPDGNVGNPMSWEYGWMFYVGGPGDWDADGEGLGPGFAALVKLARANSLEWIRFDADGPEIEGIPTFDW